MTGRYYGEDKTENFYPPKAAGIPGITQGILQPIPRLQGLVLTIIEQTGALPTAADWVDIRQSLAEDEKDLRIVRAFFSSAEGATFNKVIKELSTVTYKDEYSTKWDVSWIDHLKSVTEIKSALDSPKGLTKQMLTSEFI